MAPKKTTTPATAADTVPQAETPLTDTAAKAPYSPPISGTNSPHTPRETLGEEGLGAFSAEGEPDMRYPLLVARLKACRETGLTMVSAVRISARRDGFRRAGMSHPKAATDHPPTTFTEDQLELLLGEPNLVVEFI